jgi:hypothetical protein
VVAPEALLIEANEMIRATTGIPADHTGTSGLAGFMQLVKREPISAVENVAVLITGVER